MNATEAAYVEKLKGKNVLLVDKNVFLADKVARLADQNTLLEEQLEWFRRQIFGKRSEKHVKDLDQRQLYIAGLEPIENTPEHKQRIKAHSRTKRRKGEDKITLPPDLPVEQIVLDLPDDEKVCSKTGKPLAKIGEEISYKLAHKPGSYYVKQIIRPKYGLPNGEGVVTAELPDSILPRCRADESLLAEILVQKFADHLPLYRIQERLSRKGIGISRQLLSQWVIGVGKALRPLYTKMREHILASDNVFIDETPIPLQAPGKGKVHKATMWVLCGGRSADPPYRIYDFRLDRRGIHAEDLLKNYQGVLHSDKYQAYEKLAKKRQVIWCPCWAHIRRKFFEAESDPEFRQIVLRKIRYLYMLDRVAWARSVEERLKIRQDKEVPIIDELIALVKEKLASGPVLPKSNLSKALGYFCGLIPHLKTYTKHPFARLDNNVAERAVRPLAIGRKNWLFVGSVQGGQAAAVIFSLVQTCRGLGINPREYLEDVMRRLNGHNSQKLSELLPDQWADYRKKTNVADICNLGLAQVGKPRQDG